MSRFQFFIFHAALHWSSLTSLIIHKKKTQPQPETAYLANTPSRPGTPEKYQCPIVTSQREAVCLKSGASEKNE